MIRKDIKFLQEAKAQQPSKNFTEALAVVESVREAMKRGLHFAKGYEDANLNFYERFFKARHEDALQMLMFQRRYKPDEWQSLNFALAMIYAKMAAAMTWTRRAELALELYRTALIYAEASGDKNAIAKIRDDIAEIETSLPTPIFLDAKAELAAIQLTINQSLHFEKGFEYENVNFYENQFKAKYVFTLIRIMNVLDYKPEELKELKAIIAAINIQVGIAMTWAVRADLALERFQKALIYAEASGDAQLIDLVRKRVDEWRKINEQIADRSNFLGCLGVVAAIVVVLWLAL